MRKYSILQKPVSINLGKDVFVVKKVLYYKAAHCDYYVIYVYDTTLDTFGVEFFSSFESVNSTEAEQKCAREFEITASDWVQIEDPQEFCNLDFIVPTRRKGRDSGACRDDGTYEQYIDGTWVEKHEDEL